MSVLGTSLYFADEAIYLDAARHLLAGEGYGTRYANVPGYPVILAAFAAPWPSNLLLIRCVQALIAGTGSALLVALGTPMIGTVPALVAALLYALDPLLVVASGLLYPEAVTATLLMTTLLVVWGAARDDDLLRSALAGVLLAITIQCRPVAFVLLPVLALWIAAAGAVPRMRQALHALALVVCCLAALVPWALHNNHLHGHIVPVQMPGIHGAPVATSEIASYGLAGAVLRRVWQEPRAVVAHVASEFGYFWELYPTRLATDNPEQRAVLHQADPRLPSTSSFPSAARNWVSVLSFGGELSLALVGLCVAWRRQRAATVLLLGVTFAYALGYALFVAKLRYRIVVLPCILLLAGVGATALAGAAPERWRRRPSP
ncbi:MAG: glycosyltransferase family 39 protein [Deltaproteobacteria bacterium]|nr:glycosyltransferase family 39 protein [Deltaproteobacteria bacterium]